MKKIHITTLGCKVNQYESASFYSSFEELGHHIVATGSEADIVVINTCCVTGKAGSQSRQAIRKALRDNPASRVIITGCYSEIADKDIITLEELQGRSVSIVGNGDKHLLVDTALQEDNFLSLLSSPIEEQRTICSLPITHFGSRTRAYLRIQDGCNSFCSYCIVPYTRGRSRSLPVNEVLKQATVFEQQGYKEIVVTGIHVGYYGEDLEEEADISTIMEMLCRTTPAVRYRLSSIEPLEISDELLAVMTRNVNFMPHLHIPLQSADDTILLRMNRRYSTRQFSEILDRCRSAAGDIAVGIDILAGFPGETEDQFTDAYAFLEGLNFTYLHVFPYSRRPGTPAAEFSGQVTKADKDRRVSMLRKLSN